MKTKQELLDELSKIEELEKQERENKIKEENYKKFLDRPEDYMVGKAHCDLSFIGKRYSDERLESVFPVSVSITGNCGTTFQGKIPMTGASKTYYRNIWDDGKISYERAFDEELRNLTKKYVDLVCNDISCKLELMGLQSNSYFINEDNFPKDKLEEIKRLVELAQADILNRYSDDEIKSLVYEYPLYDDNNIKVGSDFRTRLSHSNMILYRYIFKNRQTLQKYFSNTEFYKQWVSEITK